MASTPCHIGQILIPVLFALGAPSVAQTIRLYAGAAPGSEQWSLSEQVVQAETFSPQLKWLGAVTFNVSVPTLTIFRPDPAKANGTAVIICPGGAFHFLAMDIEGEPMARWLRDQGITVFLLKYRVVQTTPEHRTRILGKDALAHIEREIPAILSLASADGRAALKYVRDHAADFGIVPTRVGMVGGSAGAMLTVSLVLDVTSDTKPDFIGVLYTNVLEWMRPLVVPQSAPPAFIVVASDDQFAKANTEVYNAWIAAGRSAELHAYAQGGHGFGMLRRGLPVDTWIERFQ